MGEKTLLGRGLCLLLKAIGQSGGPKGRHPPRLRHLSKLIYFRSQA